MDLSSRFSLYDMLAMIIPGGIIIAWLIFKLGCENWPQTHNVIANASVVTISGESCFLQSFLFLACSYLVGLINNWISDGVFRGMRNYELSIKNEAQKVSTNNDAINLRKYISYMYKDSKESIICLPNMCFLTLRNIIREWPLCRTKGKTVFNNSTYYKAYYKLASNNKLGSIPIIESQVALLRNMIIPLTIFLVWNYISYSPTINNCFYFILPLFLILGFVVPLFLVILYIIVICTQSYTCITASTCIWIPIILITLIYTVMIQRQNKVYQLVWESINYYEL